MVKPYKRRRIRELLKRTHVEITAAEEEDPGKKAKKKVQKVQKVPEDF